MEHNFTRGPADDGVHDYITCNEFKPERMVSIGQLLGGTLIAFGLVAAYVFVAWVEG